MPNVEAMASVQHEYSQCEQIDAVSLFYVHLCLKQFHENSDQYPLIMNLYIKRARLHAELERALGRAHTFAYHKIGH